MNALSAHSDCWSAGTRQYTLRNVPESVDHALRERARRRRISLNQATIEVIKQGLGVTAAETSYDDLDDLAGTWCADEAFEQAIRDQDDADAELCR